MNNSIKMRQVFCIFTLLICLVLGVTCIAGESPHYSPYVDQPIPRQVFWGDAHLHSSFSADAGLAGNRLGPDAAYRFAKGEVVEASGGQKARLIRPLDFVVLADHAENLGLVPMLAEANPTLLATAFGRKLQDLIKTDNPRASVGLWGKSIVTGKDPIGDRELIKRMWRQLIAAAERHNIPGKFTALIGYEWTSTPATNNLHRVVVFRDNGDKAESVMPFSSYDSADPERLWEWMEKYESSTGGRLLAIPHNSNLSNGLMFAVETGDARPIDREYAERRARWEPLVEVTQIKGDSETHPLLSPDDDFADYETWDRSNMGLATKTPDMLPYEYVRSALRIGLEQENILGVNPFKFGMIGSTDSHTSLATTTESNFFGKLSLVEPSADRARFYEKMISPLSEELKSDISVYHWEAAASGLAAIWAHENTRASLFDAMKRKEVYATTGSRITVRFFGGWNYSSDDIRRPDFVDIGYSKGVPMGGDLPQPAGSTPKFLVAAAKDSDGANLDRIQIIKGWVDKKGNSQEKVYNVALSDNRKISRAGKVKPVGNTVDVSEATWLNTIGAVQLFSYWRDPDFDPHQRAFYYVRVIEIPTPRWTTYDAKRFGVAIPEGAPATTQERAYTTPIWYRPAEQ